MSKIILIVAIFITVNNWVVGQSLIEPIGQITKQDIAILEKRVMASDYQSVAINLNVLKELEGKNIPISFFDLNTTVVRDRMEVRGLKRFSWFGENEDNLTSVILTVRGDDIQGTIIHKIEIFKIQTIGKRYFIVKVDQSKYPDEECTIVDELSKKNRQIKYNDSENLKNGQNFSVKRITSAKPFTCKLRLLVLYTPKAEKATSNILCLIETAIDEMRQSFIKSAVNREIKLVYAGKTTYTESSNYNNDLNYFADDNDNYMDEVHNLRNKHQADICVLIVERDDICGKAKTILADASSAFCIVNRNCATGYYSFAHEIGHLIGCQHNQSDAIDSNLSALYPFAHGYKSPNGNWRTIVTHNCLDGCPRLPYWSNPNVSYEGIPMGITNTNDNAKMLNKKFPNAMSFLQPDNTLLIENTDVLNASINGDVIAKNKIETKGNITLQSGRQPYSFRAGSEIVLKSGFTVKKRGEFVAEIVSVNDCGQADDTNEPSGPAVDIQYERLAPRFLIYPNPTSQSIKISLITNNNSNIVFKLFDYLGKEVKKLGRYYAESGVFYKEFDVSDIPKGVYFISVLRSNREVLTQKVVIN